jgi:hypothetical protein
VHFCTSVNFKSLAKKTPTDPDKMSEELLPLTSCWEIYFGFYWFDDKFCCFFLYFSILPVILKIYLLFSTIITTVLTALEKP